LGVVSVSTFVAQDLRSASCEGEKQMLNKSKSERNKKQDYLPRLNSSDPFMLDLWCNDRPRQLEILRWIERGGEELKKFFEEERQLSALFGEGYA
jgi:hypothetical protein